MISIKRIASLSLMLICANVLFAQQTVSFNFSLSSRPVTGWVNVFGDPSQSGAPRSATDPASGISISSVAIANWSQYSGTGAQNDNGNSTDGFFPGAVMRNRWYQYGVNANYFPGTPQLLIKGLNKDSVYTFKMSSTSPSNTLLSDPTRYRVTGLVVNGPLDLNIHNNSANGVTFYNVAPDDSGWVKVYVNTVPGTDVADISGLQIIRERTPAPAPIINITSPVPNDVRAEDADIVFRVEVAANGSPIWKVQYYRDSTLMYTALSAPYSWTWEHVDEGMYTIRVRVVDSLGKTATDDVSFRVEPLSGFWSTTGNIRANADTNFVGTVDTNRLAFRTNNFERMTILKDGTVGIGTKDTKGYQLAVNGSGIFTKIRIKAYAGWPDYVFDKKYKLRGLDSLERFIDRNKHLPGVTPAAQVGKEGLDIAEGQAVLLQKIEELTLYLIKEHKARIQERKAVEQLRREVKRLKAESDQRKKEKR